MYHDYIVVVDKSTVPVGATSRARDVFEAELEKRSADLVFDVVSNPEFHKDWQATDDFIRSDRVVIRSIDEHASSIMREM